MRRQALHCVIIVAWVALLHRRCSDSWSVLSFDDCDADYCVNMSRSLQPCYGVSAKTINGPVVSFLPAFVTC